MCRSSCVYWAQKNWPSTSRRRWSTFLTTDRLDGDDRLDEAAPFVRQDRHDDGNTIEACGMRRQLAGRHQASPHRIHHVLEVRLEGVARRTDRQLATMH